MNIKISENQMLNQDTTHVKKELEKILQSSSTIKKHEDTVSFVFQNLTPYDMMRRLKNEKYREWFKKLDSEIPGLPYFLNEHSNSLLFFLMGNIEFTESNFSVVFSKMDSSRFFREKVVQMKNLCTPHNISPQSGIEKLSRTLSGEKNSSSQVSETPKESQEKKGAIKNFLDTYGSIAFLSSKDKTATLTLIIDEIPSKISFIKNLFVQDPSLPQQFFITALKTDSNFSMIKAHILTSPNDIENSIKQNNGVFIQVVTKAEDGSYQILLESESPFPVTVTTDLEKDRALVEEENRSPSNDESLETEIVVPEMPIETPEQEKAADNVVSEVIEETEIMKLKKENTALVEKVKSLEQLVKDYEEEVMRKRTVRGFFGKFFK
ncbi:MAG: hypothetical protein ACOX2F_11490 [bacterium]